MFFLVKLLEEAAYGGPLHFDAHAYRSEDAEGVWAFALGCMRTYPILKEKAARFNADAEIQGILKKLGSDKPGAGKYSKTAASALVAEKFDRTVIAGRGLDYEKLDQLTTEILLGVR
jgi:xylose isomerase